MVLFFCSIQSRIIILRKNPDQLGKCSLIVYRWEKFANSSEKISLKLSVGMLIISIHFIEGVNKVANQKYIIIMQRSSRNF